MGLRGYQQRQFDKAVQWLKTAIEPAVLEAATGAGKSHIIAAIAHWVNGKSDKKVLCLAPNAELVEQNHGKYVALGEPASFYCASLSKSMRHDVIFGTPKSVINNIDAFKGKIAAVIIDEAHGITPTVKDIVAHLKADFHNLRVLGLSATPYRLGTGYIYQYDENGNPVPDTQARDPYFNTLLDRITARELIDLGYLTPPITESMTGYNASSLELQANGKFNSREVEEVFEGRGRKTAQIVREVVEMSADRRGVIIFAATVKHAEEVLESLPRGNSAMIDGSTKKRERKRIINAFKRQEIKYLVNVAVLTTGFDAPHVDVVAILRATESVGLFQQMIGRGLRLYDGKDDCLVLDYAENIERHCPDGDIFNPDIKAVPAKTGEYTVNATCPDCGTINQFGGRPNPDEFEINEAGYFVDLAGNEIMAESEGKPMPAHFGRRCLGQSIVRGESIRCGYRWSAKECPECEHENDIAARYCEKCGEELVDPNEKLRLEFAKIKKDPYSLSTDKVLGWQCQKHISGVGNETLRITYTTEYRTFDVWYLPKKKSLWIDLNLAVYGKVAPDVDAFLQYVNSHGKMPETVTVRRDRGSKFYSVYGHNRPEDKEP